MKYLYLALLFCFQSSLAFGSSSYTPVRVSDYEHCQAFADKADTNQDVGVSFQRCLNTLPDRASIRFPAGTYNLSGNVIFHKSVKISTETVSATSRSCGLNEHNRCATFQFNYGEGPFEPRLPSYLVTGSDVSFDHLIFSGSKNGPNRDANCTGNHKNNGGTIRVNGTDFKITGSVLKNLPCYTALEVAMGADRLRFQNNLVANNGTHTIQGQWADGVTVHDIKEGVVTGNVFINNTDVDLIFGGCQRCKVKNNTINHSGPRSGSSFSAFMIYAWRQTSGNYSGSVFESNRVNCGIQKGCGYGLYIGGAAWRPAKVYGAVVRNNTVSNAIVALAVDGVIGRTDIVSNHFSKSGGVFHGRCIGTRYVQPINIEPASARFINGNLFDLPDEMFSSDIYTESCIYNHYFENPLQQNFEFLVTQFYYGFLGRDVESDSAISNWNRHYNRYGLKSLAKAIANSPEAKTVNSTNRQKIVSVYRAILRRDPENEEVIASWNQYLNRHGFNQLIEAIANSAESRRTNSAYRL